MASLARPTARLALGALLTLGMFAVQPAAAQDIGALRDTYRIGPLPGDAIIARPSSPGATLSIPGAWGASWGLFFTGAGYQQRTRFTDSDDGAVFAGFGLGNPLETLGIEVALTLSIVPLPSIPLTLTPTLVDVTGSAGDGTRFTIGLGFATRFIN